MPEGVLLVAMLALGVAAMVLELRGPTEASTSKGARAAAYGFAGMMMLVALSPWLAWLQDQPLPVQRPAEPWRDGSGCSSDSDTPTAAVVIALALYVAVRGGPGPWLALIKGPRHREGATVPSGRRALRLAIWAFAIVGGLATARILVGGASVEAYTTYGAITPRGATGWRADAYLALLDDREPIPEGSTIHGELERHDHAHGPSFTTALPGVQAWVGGRPALFHMAGGQVLGSWVERRDEAMIPHERRPHFAAWPDQAVDRGWQVIVGRGEDGGLLVIKASGDDLDVLEATYGDAWLFVAPPWWPWLIAMALAALAFVTLAATRESPRPWARLLAAWLLLESTTLLLFAYARMVVGCVF